MILTISVIIASMLTGILYSQSATLSGTIFTNNLESDVRSGGLTIEITLTSVIWSGNVGTDHSSTTDLINAFTGDQNWKFVTDALDYTHVERVNGSLVVINLPAVPDYFLSADETIKLTVPASCLFFYGSPVPASPAIIINNEDASVSVSGSIQNGTADRELDIRNGNADIVLTLIGDQWESTVGTNSNVNENLISGIAGSLEWNSDVVSAILGSDKGASNTAVSGNDVRISIPAVADYNIFQDDNVNSNVPSGALIYTASGTVSGDPVLTVVAEKATASINDPGLTESTVDGGQLTLSLDEDEFTNSTLAISNFTHNGPGEIIIDAVDYVSESEATITLGLSGELTGDVTDFRITVSRDELEGNKDLTSNGISILDEEGPVITNVNIPEGTYGIGDTVRVEITVADDQGAEYAYNSGTVAGKTLTGLQRESSVLYTAYFVVAEGDQSYAADETIPVNNLQLVSGSLLGNTYDGVIDNNTIIDTDSPVINYMRPPLTGVYKVGEQISIIVSANGENYTYVESETMVNNVSITESNVTFQEIGDGLYILKYTVNEGDNDVATGNLTASLQLQNSTGNLSQIETTLYSNSLSIDANSPVVTSISVDDGVYNIGDEIVVDIKADGNNYAATNDTYINGVPLSFSNVRFSNVSGNNYRLYYEVRSVDPEVLPGNLEVVVYLRDGAGNIGGPYDEVEPNSLSIYTALPSAILSGTQGICEGEEAELTVSLTGRSPWRVYLSDGSSNTEYEVNSSPYTIRVSPPVTTTYSIDSVVDVNGTPNAGTGTATVSVSEKTDVEIINLNSSYYIEADPVQLEANPSGGVFSGPGVNSATGVFDPGEADTVNSPHTIYYDYTNATGCTSTDSALVFVLGAEGDLFIPKEVYCDYSEAFTVTGSNVAEDTGSFTLYDANNAEIDGMTDNGDNTATVDPSVLVEGAYSVEYKYFDGTWFFLKKSFLIETVESAEILIPDQNEYCQSAVPFEMAASDPLAVFSGPGVTGNVDDGFIYHPDSAYVGENTITLTRTSENGCESSVTKTINIIPMPELNFTVDNLCVSRRDTVYFNNTTRDKDIITAWGWNFDDADSDEENTSTEESPWHIFEGPGVRNIQLTAETEAGCVDTLVKSVEFEDNPVGSFHVESECYEEGNSILVTSMMTSSSEIVNYEWTITDPEGETEVIEGGEEISYSFDSLDTWTIHLYAETGAGCAGEFERDILFKPSYALGDTLGYYFENFNDEDAWWSAGMADSSAHLSWNFNTVNFTGLNNETSQAWFTDLPSSQLEEYSWVKSPCFDFTAMERPMISVDIFRSLSANNEGVILQSTTDGGLNWQTVGKVESGIEWYNSDEITPAPDSEGAGWTGVTPFAADEGWVNARHDLDHLAGEDNVQFRISFASDHESAEAGREGFAFDNVRINERNRKVLIEHFTNTSNNDSREVDGIVNNIYNLNFENAVKLEYHTSFPGEDPFNIHNSSVPATRSFYYGVAETPYSLLDGGYAPRFRIGYVPDRLDQKDLKAASLMESPFNIEINAEYSSDNVVAEVEVTALRDLEPAERIVHIVVYEKLITGVSTNNGASNFLNVVKDMLPNSAGTAVFEEWEKDETRTFSFTWEYSNVYDPDMIRIASFIQDDATKEVYQASSDDTTNLTTSIGEAEPEIGIFNVYPNPATENIFVHIDNKEKREYILELYDQLGRSVLRTEMYSYENVKRMDVSGIEEGVYILRIGDGERGLMGVRKVVIGDR